jgi:predicted DNA-binding protein with PD1-like motif
LSGVGADRRRRLRENAEAVGAPTTRRERRPDQHTDREHLSARPSPRDLLLESIEKFIKDKGIQDGAILTGIGSLGECTFQFPERAESPPPVKSETYQGPLEITGMQGLIADFEPHLHLSVAERGHERIIGGHLGPNCRVLYLAEITIAKFAGQPMTRKPNEHGVKLLTPK